MFYAKCLCHLFRLQFQPHKINNIKPNVFYKVNLTVASMLQFLAAFQLQTLLHFYTLELLYQLLLLFLFYLSQTINFISLFYFFSPLLITSFTVGCCELENSSFPKK